MVGSGGIVGSGIGKGISDSDGKDGMLTSGMLMLRPSVGRPGIVGSGMGNGTSERLGSDGIETSGMVTDRPSVGSSGIVGIGIGNGMSEKEGNEQALKSQPLPTSYQRQTDRPDPTPQAWSRSRRAIRSYR